MVSPSLLQSLIHKHTGEAEEVLVSDLLLTIGHVNNAPTMQFRNEVLIYLLMSYMPSLTKYTLDYKVTRCGIHLTSSFEQEPLIGT